MSDNVVPFIRDKGEARNWPAPQHLIIDRRRDMAEIVEKAIAAVEAVEAKRDWLEAIANAIARQEPEGTPFDETFKFRVNMFMGRVVYCKAWLQNFRAAGYDRSQMAEILQGWDGEIGLPSLAFPEGIDVNMADAALQAECQKLAIANDPAEAKRAARIWLQANGANEAKLVEAIAAYLQNAAKAEKQ